MRIVLLLTAFFLGQYAIAYEYFPENYVAARKNFIELSKQYDGELTSNLIASKVDNDLTVNIAYFPAKEKKKKLIILTSGIHGPESYLGSAAQVLFLKEYFSKINRKETSVLLIHSLNPYGFKYGRRTSENNIDLNRNMSTTEALFKTKNEGHNSMLSVLSPSGIVTSSSLSSLIWSLVKKLVSGISIKEIRNGITSGQYEYANSIYYGGESFSQQRDILLNLYKKITKKYTEILALDFHTGLGDNGQLHLISGGKEHLNELSIKQQEVIFNDKSENYYKLTTADTPGFYSTTGDMNDFLAEVCGKEKLLVALTAEFGTMGLNLPKQIISLNRMIKENQGHHYGYENTLVESEVKKSFLSLFYPNNKVWKNKVIKKIKKIYKDEFFKFIDRK